MYTDYRGDIVKMFLNVLNEGVFFGGSIVPDVSLRVTAAQSDPKVRES